jgi:hypothetical protein
MLCALLGGVTDQSAASRRGQAYVLDVEPGLHLAQHDVVDAALVAPSLTTVAKPGKPQWSPRHTGKSNARRPRESRACHPRESNESR